MEGDLYQYSVWVLEIQGNIFGDTNKIQKAHRKLKKSQGEFFKHALKNIFKNGFADKQANTFKFVIIF